MIVKKHLVLSARSLLTWCLNTLCYLISFYLFPLEISLWHFHLWKVWAHSELLSPWIRTPSFYSSSIAKQSGRAIKPTERLIEQMQARAEVSGITAAICKRRRIRRSRHSDSWVRGSVRRNFFLSSLSGGMTAEYRTGPDWTRRAQLGTRKQNSSGVLIHGDRSSEWAHTFERWKCQRLISSGNRWKEIR